MPDFYIPDRYRPGLDRIATLSDTQFEALRNALASTSPALRPLDIIGNVNSFLKADIPDAEDIINTLFSLSNARQSADASIDEMVRDLSAYHMERNKNADRATVEQRLKSLLSLDVLLVSARAFDVQHAYDKLFVAARIMSDIRTVFDQAGTTAVGSMIVHNLMIRYSQAGDFKHVIVALDEADIAKLRKVIDRAEAKGASLQALIAKTDVQYLDSK